MAVRDQVTPEEWQTRVDLAACLDRLLADCASGTAHFKLYRQFKMYNDPALNPAVYGEKRARDPFTEKRS